MTEKIPPEGFKYWETAYRAGKDIQKKLDEPLIQYLKQQLEVLRQQAGIYYQQIQQAKEEVADKILEEIGKYHTDAPFHNFSVYLTEAEWQALKSKHLKR